jgi:hypothetical protein
MNSQLLKALEPYSGAYLISIIWGEVGKEMPKYRLKIMRRLKTGKFEKLELEKLNAFLIEHKRFIDAHLNSV